MWTEAEKKIFNNTLAEKNYFLIYIFLSKISKMFASNYNYQHNLLSKTSFFPSVSKQVFLIVTETLGV